MEQKDYKAIAEIIKDKLVGNDLPDTAKEIAEALADYFEKTSLYENGIKIIFDREQFIKDCGVK